MVPGAVGSRTCGILRVRLLLQRRKTWSSNRCTWDNYPCLRLPFACFSRSLQSSAGRASSRDGVCNAHWRRLCHRQLLGASFLAATHVDFGHWRCLAKQRAGDDGDEDVSYDIEDFGDIDDDDEFNFDEFDPTMTFENSGRAISVKGAAWGYQALQVVEEVLQREDMKEQGLALWAFNVDGSNGQINIILDNLNNKYGSPTIDQVEAVSRVTNELLDVAAARPGAELPEGISASVSSPGAERQILVPDDLDRFGQVPLKVAFKNQGGGLETQILRYTGAVEDAEGSTLEWAIADVKANRGKGRPKITRKQRETVVRTRLEDIVKVNVFVDF
mmetsp:Transcript_5017/g.18212  ORF Transcript_5017/g.18212 Transcript_5017/m.18212 type:complete len:331 (-) Transcript_5017:4621-5613(-)